MLPASSQKDLGNTRWADKKQTMGAPVQCFSSAINCKQGDESLVCNLM